MESETNSLLSVPITDAERRAIRQRQAHNESSRTLVGTPPESQHAHEREINPRVGRFSSLRQPGERYDDPDANQTPQPARFSSLRRSEERYDDHDAYQDLSASATRPSTRALDSVDEESHYSDHDDEAPLKQTARASTFPRTSGTAYQPVRNPPELPRQQHHHQPFSPKFWQPRWLTKLSLISMAVVLLALMACLIVACKGADSGEGWHISSSTQHYAWTYAPTMILILVTAVWRQIDFHTKSMMPWKALAMGPESPFDSILVDYFSEFQFISLIAAFKRLHIPVTITIVAFITSKGITIAGTGLFYAQSETLTHGFPTRLTSSFDAAALDPAILTAGSFPNTSVYTYTQNVVNGLGPQLGIADGFAYLLPILQSSASEAVPANSTFHVVVDTFVPRIFCRAANVTLDGEATIETVDFPYNSTETEYGSPSNITLAINENTICPSFPELTFRGLDPLHHVVPGQTLESRSQEISCEDGSQRASFLLLTMVEVLYTQDLLTNVTREEGGSLPIALNTSRSVSRMVNVLCQADYSLGQVNITNNTALEGVAALTLTPVRNPENKTIDRLSSANMTTIYAHLLGSNTGLFTGESDDEFTRTPAFDLLSWVAGSGRYDDLFNDTVLADSAQKIYLGTMPDFASQNFLTKHADGSGPSGPIAQTSWAEQRLHTNWTPVIFVMSGLGIMVLLTIGLIILVPKDVVPRDPNSIAASATVLSRSFELNRLLRKLQAPQNKGLAAALNGYDVGTAIAVDESTGSKSFKIHVTEGRPERAIQEIAPGIKYWNPIWASLAFLAAAISAPLILIAILEVFQRRSDANHGLWDVPADRGTLVASHFIPAFATLVVASMINNVQFYITLFAPWARLLKTKAPPKQSILKNAVGHTALHTVWITGQARWWGAHAATIATILASLLTVIISGLYVVDFSQADGPARSLLRLDTFDLNRISVYSVNNDNGAGAMLNLIQHASDFPNGTFGEYAFPRVSLVGLNSNLRSGSYAVGTMRGTLPALRGELVCENATTYGLSTIDSIVRVTASYDVPESCRANAASLNESTVSFSTDFSPSKGSTEFGGRQFDLRFGANSSIYGHLGEANSSLVGGNPSAGCPSLVFVWGNFQLASNDKSMVHVAVCQQKVQTINANVTMQQNTTYFGSLPPLPDEKSAVFQRNPNGTTDVFDFRIQSNLARQLGSFSGGNSNIDPFFQAMLKGPANVDPKAIVGDETKGIQEITHMYRMYMAQVFNAILREAGSSRNTAARKRQQATLPDLRTTVTTSRLVQDRPSKIILQILLGLSAILILVGYVLTKIRNVLPCNPCSIAGTMSLLAGSDLCYSPDNGICECCGKVRRSYPSGADSRTQLETIHPEDDEHEDQDQGRVIRLGAEWMDDSTFARIFEGHKYSLGWWEPNPRYGKAKRYGVDYGAIPTGDEEGDWYLGKRRDGETLGAFSEGNRGQEEGGRGRSRALSDVNERGAYQRAEPSPGVEAFEMKDFSSKRNPVSEGT